MKALLLGLMFVVSAHFQAQAQQMELPLQHPNDVLLKTDYRDANIALIDYSQLPPAVRSTLGDVEFASEAGDGYYDIRAVANYVVFDGTGNIVGYMEMALLSYTEDADYFTVGAWVTPSGKRLDKEIWLDSFATDDQDSINALPPELRPQDEE